MAWRKAERVRLIDERLHCSVDSRLQASTRIIATLDSITAGALTGRVVSGYWPLRGEPDMRPWLKMLCDRGVDCALPVVVEKNAALHFHRWTPGARLTRGFWGIPVPADREELQPDLLLAPVVGFDAQCYRLGYGGGYFDRTLASSNADVQVIGIGYEAARLTSIFPLPHDIALGCIVTEIAVHGRKQTTADSSAD